MTPVIILGYALGISGAILGLLGAIWTASKDQRTRHNGFIVWLINAPLLISALLGASLGVFEPLSVLVLCPLNTAYFYTAFLGHKNTKEYNPSEHMKDKGS